VLTVSIFSRLLSQLGVAVANHMADRQWDTPPELRPLANARSASPSVSVSRARRQGTPWANTGV
jgi:hypothetical protein